MNAVLLSMAGLGVSAVVLEKVLMAFGKTDYAQLVNICGLSLIGTSTVGLVIKLLKSLKTLN